MSVALGAGPSPNPYNAHRHLLRPEEVRELSRLRVAPPLRDSALAWLEICAALVAVAIWPTWWVVLVAVPVIGTAHYALQILGHDAMHRRYRSDPRQNDLLADLVLYGPVGGITHVIARNHLLHHLHLASDRDPDRHKYATAGKATKMQLVLYLGGFSNVLPVIRNVFLRRAGDPSVERPELTPSRAQRGAGYTGRDLAIVAGWQALLLVGMTWFIGWWAYPVLWLLPVYVFRYCADQIRQFLEHAHLEPDEIADTHRLITYVSSPVERIFFSPLNMNLHTAHHLWPSIPYYNLPRADRLIRERNRSPELIWRGSYLASLRDHFRALPLTPAADSGMPRP